MKHARADYNRIQDPWGKIPDEEPVFLLRAKDKLFCEIVRAYALALEVNSGDPDMVQMCRQHADHAENYQRAHPPKLPDLAPAVERYFISSDNSGHWYAVPTRFKTEWVEWQEFPPEDERSWTPPDFATRVDGNFTFTDPTT